MSCLHSYSSSCLCLSSPSAPQISSPSFIHIHAITACHELGVSPCFPPFCWWVWLHGCMFPFHCDWPDQPVSAVCLFFLSFFCCPFLSSCPVNSASRWLHRSGSSKGFWTDSFYSPPSPPCAQREFDVIISRQIALRWLALLVCKLSLRTIKLNPNVSIYIFHCVYILDKGLNH